MFGPYRSEVEFVLQAVRTAAGLSRRIQGEMVSPAMEKSDRSPVTVADFASQAIIARMLQEAFPDDPLVAEEDSTELRVPAQAKALSAVTSYVSSLHPEAHQGLVCHWIDHGSGEPGVRFWVLDPIDGTKGFLRGDQYVVALALVEEGRVVLGAMGCPNLNSDLRPEVGGAGSVVLAVRDHGAWVTGMDGGKLSKIQVSGQQDPKQARLLRSFAAEHTNVAMVDQLVAALGSHHPPLLMDSAAKYAVLAVGDGDLLFRLISLQKPDYVENIWDQAAGSIIVEEAGGKVSDLTGRDLDFGLGRQLTDNLGVLASNGWLHEAALEALRVVGADRRPEGS